MTRLLAHTFALLATTVFGATICPPTDTSLQTVTFTGYVMDNFCIDMGTMVDNPSKKTLVDPQVHSIHCLTEVQSCVQSQYAMLEKLATPTNGALYGVKYQLGADGSALALEYANAAMAKGGSQGFTATVTGYYDGKNPTLQCVSLAAAVNVDGKDMTLTTADLVAGAKKGLSTTTIVVLSVLGWFLVWLAGGIRLSAKTATK
ncbi:Aste57867_1765 [Aphanomyces stellatus]|uniref:Aste57867_1765 protein n=1 Tax=Aphanomyces stellatus TaxID=120398 RepID=A0A485K770_9STRA|nr:hypothetical protein As57867_001763 [Aphanomyces stellatus]VFT78974.1 Aste57867_1765 [Aphanomyces stellatus]